MATIKSGVAASRKNLRVKLALERVLQRSLDTPFVTPAMQTGTDRQPLARVAYEQHTGALVSECGFIRSTVHPWAGCSIDGHCDAFTRLVEFKCRQPAAHWDFLRTGTIPGDALAQIRHELWIIPQAEAVDYVCWSPDFPERLQLRIVTVTRAEADIPSYQTAALAFLAEVELDYQAILTLAGAL